MASCDCEKNEDGQCLPCKEKMALFFEGMVKLQKLFYAKIDHLKELHDPQSLCEACKASYADVVMVEYFRLAIEPMSKRSIAVQMYSFAVQAARMFGAMATPHLDRMWVQMCSDNGWDPALS